VLDQHHMSHHCFADDTQAYVDVPRSQVATVAPQLQNCIADMSNWCGARRLQLNPTKTEVMWFGSKASLQCIPSSEKNIARCAVWQWNEHVRPYQQDNSDVLSASSASAPNQTSTRTRRDCDAGFSFGNLAAWLRQCRTGRITGHRTHWV